MPPSRLRQALRTFRRDERGVVAILFAVMAVGLVTVTAVAIDVGNVYRIRSALQGSLDSAMLSVGADPDEDTAHIRQQVRQFFEANLAGVLQTGTVNVTDLIVRRTTRTNITHADLTATSQTFFGGLLNRDTVTYSLTSTVQRAAPTEVAIVMSEGRYTQLWYDPFAAPTQLEVFKRVASDLVKAVLRFPDNRVAIVPYSSLVKIDASGGVAKLPGWVEVKNLPKPLENPPPGWTGCVGLRPGEYATRIDRPTQVKYPTYQEVGPRYNWSALEASGLSTWPYCQTPVIQLYDRSRQQSILKRIESMWSPDNNSNQFQGYDNVALGLIWGWNMLNPEGPFPARTKAEVERIGGKKVLVLFAGTDTSGGYLPAEDGQPRQVSRAGESQQAIDMVQEICRNIREDGIIIYVVLDRNTIKHGPDGPSWGMTTFPLDDCATDKNKTLVNFTEQDKANPYDPGDRLTPMYAMREVGRQLTEPRLIPCPEEFCPP